ncbi:MAG: DUF4416 family protein [Proteobacteria bacterium]|nr:DUF4416 family protein [Pseudomonadota bacterium]
MRIEKAPSPGRLVMGVLFTQAGVLLDAEKRVSFLFGPVYRRSETISFVDYTDYYEKEMGQGVNRCFWAFSRPFPRGALAEAKLGTNRIERQLAREGKRAINLDPGLLTPESLVLATTKPYSHRIYLSKGIFGDLTLMLGKGRFECMPWTYPDYRDDRVQKFLGDVRGDLLEGMVAPG